MKAALQRQLRRPFVRNVTTLATGAAASQAISMAFAPLLTRLYGPEAFGLQGVFLSSVGLIAIVAALGYPTAIVLPRDEADARTLARLSVVLGAGMALLVGAALLPGAGALLGLVGAGALRGVAWLIPLAVLATVLARVLAQWLQRRQAYALTARAGAATTLLVSLAKAGLGLVWPQAVVLIAVNTLGGLLGTLATFLRWRQTAGGAPAAPAAATPARPWRAVAAEHRDFPLLRTPQDLINALSQSLPVFLLAAWFGSAAAGRYTIAITLLGVPAALIGSSVMAVFYPRVTAAVHDGEDVRRLILQTTLGMAATCALPFVVVVAAGPWLFATLFGEPWREAGHYAQWLAPWLFLQAINQPAVAAIPALKLQGGLLLYELASTGSKAAALWLGFSVLGSDMAAVACFSLAGVVAYLWLIAWVLRRSGRPPARTIAS